MKDEYIAAIDLGSHHFKMAVARLNDDQLLELVALEEVEAEGVKKGAIINMEKAVNSLHQLRQKVVASCGYQPKEVTVAYSSETIEALNSSGVAAIGLRGKGRPITEEDKKSVIEAVQAIVIGENSEIAHIVPLKYIVDNLEQVKEPVNMVGIRLEAEAHIIIAGSSFLNNISNAIKQAGFVVKEMIYSPLAASVAVLSNNERQKGTLLLDIGFATTKITFFQHDAPYFNAVLPLGANSLTTDLAYMLNIDTKLAEQIKIAHGCAYKPLLERDDYAYIPGNADRGPEPVSEYYICDIVSARMVDILKGALAIVEQKGWLNEVTSIVVGGGGGNLPGVVELTAKIFNHSTHIAVGGNGFDQLQEQQRLAKYGAVLGLLKQNRFYTLQPLEKNLLVRHNGNSYPQERKNRVFSFFKTVAKDFF